MKLPDVSLIAKQAVSLQAIADSEAVVAFVRAKDIVRTDLGLGKLLERQQAQAHQATLKRRQFTAARFDTIYVPSAKGMLVLIGLGEVSAVQPEMLRHAGAKALKLVEQLRISQATFVWPDGLATNAQEKSVVAALTEGVLLGGYEFDKYISGRDKKFSCKEVRLAVRSTNVALKAILQEATLVSTAVNEARDMQNDNSDEVNPQTIARQAAQVAREHKLRYTEISGAQLKTKGLNLLHAVGRASPWAPRLILVEYRGAPKKQAPLAIIGKGITFDTGGVNLKPAHGMIEQMHLDMSGAAAALAVVKLAAQLKLKTNLIAALAIAENVLDGAAYKPGSVIKAHNGTTVEVTNTDAEGRLVLADANAFVARTQAPAAIINIATLTGSVLVAFGEHYAGLTSNHDGLSEGLSRASQDTGEQIWPLPLNDEYRSEIKGNKSDVVNTVMSRPSRADAIHAMAFLERFSGKVPAALVDIAGTSMRSRRTGYVPAGGTGFGVRLLCEYVRRNPKGPRASAWGSRGLARYAA